MAKKIERISRQTKDNLRAYLLKIWEIIKKPEMGILPGQLAFFMLLSCVPIITLCGYAAGFLGINIDTVTDMINKYIPSGAEFLVPYLSGDTIDLKLALILIWMFYLASNGCNTVIIISNQIYGINKSNWFKRRLKAIFMTFAIVLMLVFVLLVPVFGTKIIELLDFTNISDTLYSIFDFIKGPVTWLIMFVFIRALYEIAPDRVRKNSHINTGALFTSIGWVIVTFIYSQFANNMTSYNVFYGALSSIAILMLWLYFMSYIFVIGLSLNYGEELDMETMNKTGAIKVVKAG